MNMFYKSVLLIIILLNLFFKSHAQGGFKIKSYAAGYRIFEIDAMGTNPTTIYPLLKNPVPYMRFLNNFSYNSLWGEPGPQTVYSSYLNVELYKNNPFSRFWKKHTIQTGLYVTNKLIKGAGAIADENIYTLDTFKYSNKYSLTQRIQFLGANLGINRNFKISKRLQTTIGVQVQAGFAFVHNYQQQWDSSTLAPDAEWQTSVTYLPSMKGKNFFQWQLMLPLGMEYQLYKDKISIRMEVEPGIVNNRYRYKSFAAREAHGAGIWFIYHP